MLASPLSAESWNESEALALRAALAVIDAWDSDLGGLLEVESDSSSSCGSSDGSQSKKIKTIDFKAPKRRRRVDVRKREIIALRAQARDLQCVVALGKALVGGKASSKSRAVDLRSEWWQVSDSQQSQRVVAQMENAKLWKLMQSQVKYARHMLHLTTQVDWMKSALYVPPLPLFVNYIGPSIDPETHLRDTDTLISRGGQLFSSGPFDTSRGVQYFDQTEFRADRPPEEGADLESVGVSILPFDVRQVADAMWVYTIRPTKNNKTSMDIYQNTNATVSQFMGTACFDDRFGVIQGQVAARLLPPDLGDGSILIVTKMTASTFIGSEARGTVSSQGWIRMETVPSLDPARGSPMTIVKRYRSMLMAHPASSTMGKSERCEWTEAVVAGPIRSRFEREFDSTMLAIENALLSRQPLGLLAALLWQNGALSITGRPRILGLHDRRSRSSRFGSSSSDFARVQASTTAAGPCDSMGVCGEPLARVSIPEIPV